MDPQSLSLTKGTIKLFAGVRGGHCGLQMSLASIKISERDQCMERYLDISFPSIACRGTPLKPIPKFSPQGFEVITVMCVLSPS